MAEHLEPMAPTPWTVKRVRAETGDIFTFELSPPDGRARVAFQPGQFNMLYAFGLGEVPISISGDPEKPETLVHTIRAVGAVTKGLGKLKVHDTVGVRGPFGSPWPIDRAEGHDVVIAAGGLGLAPLRPAIYALLAHPERYGKLTLLYGARTAEDLLFPKEWEAWRKSGKLAVQVTLGQATRKWKGAVGFVTTLVPGADFRPDKTIAFVCGPEIMMRFTAQALEARGVGNDRIYLSMERNMKCAVGFCGHCQFGPELICRDGAVFPYARLEKWLRIREL